MPATHPCSTLTIENERAHSNAPHNKEMQRTKHGPIGASPLISVFYGP